MIEKGHIAKTGKEKGMLVWDAWMYPGNLEQTAARLLDDSFAMDFSAEEVLTLLDELKNAKIAILAALEAKPTDEIEYELPDSVDRQHWSTNPYDERNKGA